ncbi:MAG: DUF1801 domain-containing protein [Saprospiraceae bacterium]|jgi:nucleoid DNA-binding protein|nr:DUF1801 domain-containing protein [Saprospiraceae bacterium]
MEEIIDYIAKIEDEHRKEDCQTLLKMMSEICNEQPKLWNNSIVGFGTYQYKYESGREGEWFITGFSNRKKSLTIYIVAGFSDYKDLLAQLGNHTIGSSCLYIKGLASIDLDILKLLITKSTEYMKARHFYHN